MLQYCIETLAFQLAFLLVYDLFLKKETFFQWNRAYLLVAFGLSLVLPLVAVNALSTQVAPDSLVYPIAAWQLEPITLTTQEESVVFWKLLPFWQWGLLLGSVGMALLFVVKLYRIQKLRNKGQRHYYQEYTKIVVRNSKLAFSFFKQVFLGDAITASKETQILAHELVHVKQWHSLDLLFFEAMRIAFWFNPLVYIYQSRLAELHEFIADQVVAKEDRKAQYQMLLSQAFNTQNLSFVNQFFTQSLIKKRIVMLTKEKSKNVLQLKYLLLLPLVLGMLVYSSCESEEAIKQTEVVASLETRLKTINAEINALDSLSTGERKQIFNLIRGLAEKRNATAIPTKGRTVKTGVAVADSTNQVPFAVVDQAPVFPGCEGAADAKECFKDKIYEHIRKHFNYPKEAKDLGIQGRVALLFTIAADGNIVRIKTRGPHPLLEAEAERIIKRLPQMQPGKQKGKAVGVPFSVPITFKLPSNEGQKPNKS